MGDSKDKDSRMGGNPGIQAINKLIRVATKTKQMIDGVNDISSEGGIGVARGSEIDLTNRLPWDRIAAESDRAWEGFRLFRDMGLGRTVSAVSRDFGHADENTARGWAMKYHWRARAMSWDAHLDTIAQQEYEKEAATMGRRHAEIGMKMQGLGKGRIVEITENVELREAITVSEAINLTKAGVEIERNARGADAGKQVAGSGNITFNFNMSNGKAPKWAPKKIIESVTGGTGKMKMGEDINQVVNMENERGVE